MLWKHWLLRLIGSAAAFAGRIAVAGVAVLLAGILGAWWLADRIAAPLESITHAVETVSARDLQQRLKQPRGFSEVERLQAVFNGMLDRLQRSFERQIRFTADASHELRTPVAVVLAQTDLSLSRERDNHEYRRALESCQQAAVRMKRLIDDLLILARADSDRLLLHQQQVDLAALVREALIHLTQQAADQQITLTSQLQSVLVFADATRLEQVVSNLVTNAIRYNQPHGGIVVSVHARNAIAVLLVSDTGVGIAADQQGDIFERFFRIDQARSGGHGVGLGLSIVAEIWRHMAGMFMYRRSLVRDQHLRWSFP